jgi:hypothetical protein
MPVTLISSGDDNQNFLQILVSNNIYPATLPIGFN